MNRQHNHPHRWFLYQGQHFIIQNNETAELPGLDNIESLQEAFIRTHHLGEHHLFDCYCAELPADYVLPTTLKAVGLRDAFNLTHVDWFRPLIRGFSIINWDRNHQFCGQCGKKTEKKPHLFERDCPACGQVYYPRISPSIIVLIRNGNQLLMARSPHFRPGMYGLIAGFIEVGENIEEAVHREVAEEIGIKIKNLRYFNSQPWPFPDSLMIGFMADYDSGDIVIDGNEIIEANWYPYDQLPSHPSRISIAGKLVDAFVNEFTTST